MSSAQRLSNRLLRDEETLFARHASLLAANVPVEAVNAALRRHPDDPTGFTTDQAMIQQVTDQHTAVVSQIVGHGQQLFQRCAKLSLDSMRVELRHCERTLAAKYRGITDEAVDLAEHGVDAIVSQAVAIHQQNAQVTDQQFRSLLLQQMQYARTARDDMEKTVARITSPDPVRGHGIGGRGIWFRAASWLDASARAGSIGVMNATRRSCMAAMNEAASGR